MSKRGRLPGKREKVIEIDVLSLVSLTLIVLAGVLCFFCALSIVKSFIGVRSFEEVGGEHVEGSELAAYADIARKDKIYSIDLEEAEEKILKRCAYVERVNIKRGLTGKLKFVIKEREPVWYLEISGDYYVLDKELRVLEETGDESELITEGTKKLTMPSVKRAIEGELLIYGDGDEDVKNTETIINTLEKSDIWEDITIADIDNRYDIHITLGDAFVINFGNYSRFETKIEYVISAIEKAYAEGVIGGTVDISDNGDRVTVKPIYNTENNQSGENESVG